MPSTNSTFSTNASKLGKYAEVRVQVILSGYQYYIIRVHVYKQVCFIVVVVAVYVQ